MISRYPLFIFLSTVFAIASGGAFAQNISISQGGTISQNTCGNRFVDAGGANGSHSPNETNRQVTICNDGSEGTGLALRFNAFQVNGNMTFYDGPDDQAAELANFDEGDNGRTDLEVPTSSANKSGCLTVSFLSNGTAPGWVADIACTSPCQRVNASITMSSVAPTGGFIDLCPGETFSLDGTGLYPDNGDLYTQANATSTFLWEFQDGTRQEGVGLTNVQHRYDQPGGYIINLTITDQNGCGSTNDASVRVRVSPPPNFGLTTDLPESVCVGEEISLSLDGSGGSGAIQVMATPREFFFNRINIFADTIFLDDVVGVDQRSPITLRNFNDGQTLQSLDQIVEICAVLEHSYFFDLSIGLVCPSGDTSLLVESTQQEQSGRVIRVVLGEGDDATGAESPPDPPGRYCWRLDADARMDQYIADNNLGNGDMLPEGGYLPEGSLAGLIGCPLNGVWELFIEDNIPNDEGHFFSWEIIFTEETYANPESFTVDIEALDWIRTSNLTRFDATGAVTGVASDAGRQTFQLRATDSIGCVFDTAYTVDVLSPLDTNCNGCRSYLKREVLDTAICEGQSITPDLFGPPFDTLLTHFDQQDLRIGRGITEIPFVADEPGLARLRSVCLNLNAPATANLADLTIVAVAPDGTLLFLIGNTGGFGDDLVNVCFSQRAGQEINDPGVVPPYDNRTFQSLTNTFENIEPVDIDGEWLLQIDNDGFSTFELQDWSINFEYRSPLTFATTATDGTVASTDSLPVLTPTEPTTYEYAIFNKNGCLETATINVDFKQLEAAIDTTVIAPRCAGDDNGSIVLNLSGPDGPYDYLWNTGASTASLDNLDGGEYSVRIENEQGCERTLDFRLDTPSELVASTVAVDPVNCFGQSNGRVAVSAEGGSPAYSYSWTAELEDSSFPFNDPQIDDVGSLTAGRYFITVTDGRGCTDSTSATVSQPDSIVLTFTTDSVRCRGGNTGRATVSVAGGNGDFTFNWSSAATTATATDLTAQNYSVTVRDQRGCQASGDTFVEEPAAAVLAAARQDLRGCAGVADNVATALGQGGNGGFSYAWSNGETAATATALPAGTAFVTVTDRRGCQDSASVNVAELLSIDILIQQRAPSCDNTADGLLSANATGGVGAATTDYTYTWSSGETGFSIDDLPGNRNYSVTATDAQGCTGQSERFLQSPEAISFNVVRIPVDCYGAANGGLRLTDVRGPSFGDYSFQWGPAAGGSNGNAVINLPAGDYTVNIQDPDQNCDLDTVLTITQPDSLIATVTQMDVGCFGGSTGSLDAVASGGSGSIRYDWSDGTSGTGIGQLSSGNYGLTLTDENSCQDSFRYEITEPVPLDVDVTTEDVLCFGEATGRLSVTGLGGRPPFSYSLDGANYTRSPTFIGLSANDFRVFIRDNANCVTDTTVTVENGPTFALDAGRDTTIVFGDPLRLGPRLIGGVGNVTYNWMGSYDGTLSCDDCPNPEVSPEFEIDYSLLVIDENDCQAEDRLRVSVLKVREVAVPTGFTPNADGSNDRLVVHGRPGTQILEFDVFDRYGGLLYRDSEFSVNDDSRGWDGAVNGEPVNAGVYIWRLLVEYEDGSQETIKGETTVVR